MDTNLLDIKFARIGARLKAADRPSRRTRTVGVISLDVQADRKGEFFEIIKQPGAEADYHDPAHPGTNRDKDGTAHSQAVTASTSVRHDPMHELANVLHQRRLSPLPLPARIVPGRSGSG